LALVLGALTAFSAFGLLGCANDPCVVPLLPPAPCGLNDRGVALYTCEGSMASLHCDDPDACTDGQWRVGSEDACGENGRGVEHDLCVAGQFQATCQDPDVCEDGASGLSDVPCGLNDRGRQLQDCIAGAWSVNAFSCSDPDACVDGHSSARQCGENLRGTSTTSCVEGAWVQTACTYPSACLQGANFDAGACPVVAPTLTAPSGCPDLSSAGRITITSAGEPRQFLLYLPPNPAGKPVVVLWHELGGSAASFASLSNAAALANTHDVIVAIPEMSYQFTLGAVSAPMWRFLDVSPPEPDLALFDDILGCLDAEYGVDRTRLYAAGASAGALFSTRLLLDRADVLAGVAILSGGTEEAHRILNTTYETPAAPTPTMVAWGGTSDTLAFVPGFTLDFAAGSTALVNHLVDDGDVVVACDHGQGHAVPTPIITFALQFLVAQQYGEPNPYAVPTPPSMPAACVVRAP
jgi:poly(3-hydroxybutyrate) depolymerase